MATNLVNQLMHDFRGETLNGIASALGESPARTQTALGGVLPAVIGGLANKVTTTDQANNLLDLMKQNRLDSGPLTDVAGAVKAQDGITTLTTMGRPMVDSLFGGRAGAVTDWISSLSGFSRSSSSSLLSLALPLVLGQIGRRVSGSGWNASNLVSLLGGQRSFLQDAPAGLAGILSADETTARPVGAYETPGEGARHVGAYDAETRRQPVVAAYETAPAKRSNAWLWAIPLLLLIPLLFFLLARRNEPREVAVQTPAPRVETPRPAATPPPAPEAPRPVGTTSAPAAVAALGPLVEKRLPNDVALRIPANGVESRLIAYLEDPSQRTGKETWFSLDRVEFDTDSAALTPGASEQVRNIAEILKAYPQVKVSIGGFTDNTADTASNLKLSQDRATATMEQIAGFGVDRSRMEARGYGEENPIADNSTAEGRQRNRRVDIRVTDR